MKYILLENLKALAGTLTLASVALIIILYIAYLIAGDASGLFYDEINRANKRRRIYLKIIKVSLIIFLINIVLYFMLPDMQQLNALK